MMSEEIKSMSEYVEFIKKKCDKNKTFLYRGQRLDSNWPLLPKIGREDLKKEHGKKLLIIEKAILKEFIIKCRPFINDREHVKVIWECLALAQHHGLATRLLDWTSNPLAALWFVVRNEITSDENGVVWMFSVHEDDFVDPEKEDPFKLKYTKIFKPAHITRRIMSQGGLFTVHAHYDGKGFIPLIKNKHYKNRLFKVIIPYKEIFEIKRELFRCGTHDASLFQDLDGLCRDLNMSLFDPILIKQMKAKPNKILNNILDDINKNNLFFLDKNNMVNASLDDTFLNEMLNIQKGEEENK